MTENPRVRPGLSNARSPWDEKSADHATAFFSDAPPSNVTDVAKTLAAHGGGEAFVGLAFDLVLNDVLERAREASGATGAAIALIRDGEMVCRATTGDNAPDLGVRVETTSGLAGACVGTGQIQLCRDTDTDGRVNAEACRRLGVRSMLIAPLLDAGKVFGILQVFSAWPNAFSEREISTLQGLAQTIAENKRVAETCTAVAPGVEEESPVVLSTVPEEIEAGQSQEEIPEPESVSHEETQTPRVSEILTSVLVVLVIAAAILLGVVIGWHQAAKTSKNPAPVRASATTTEDSNSSPQQRTSSPPVGVTEVPAANSGSDSRSVSTANSSLPPSGGLVVTENGKVIYRSSPEGGNATGTRNTSERTGTRLIHRVEPAYPAEARAQNIQGSVVLIVQIHGDGSVGDIGVASGDPLLANAAVQAVKRWRYQPYFVDGQAVESQTRVTIKFRLPPN